MHGIPLGLCQCGCGQQTTVPTTTNRKIGRFKGVPMRYVSGHNARGQVLRTGPDWIAEDLGYTTPCWIWQHQITAAGYGRATVTDPTAPRRQEYAHRLAWEAENGPIPDGMEIDHLCHNADPTCPAGFECQHRRCVNPEHLEVVTSQVNSQRGQAGQAGAERQRAKTHCPRGHPYSGENLYVDATGRRHCRECRRQQLRESRARRATTRPEQGPQDH